MRVRFWLTFAVLAAALGGGAWYYLHKPAVTGGAAGGASQGAAAPQGASTPAVSVEAARVTVDTVVEELQAVGSLLPDEAVVVAPEIAGRVERIAFREGESVKAGDVLVKLDDAILRAERAKALADLTLARANHTRATTLAGQGMTTARARDEAIGALQAAEAGFALAEARLEKATIRAPLSGVLGLRSVSAGAYVAPGQRLVELAAVDPIKLDFRVPELVLTELRQGQTVRVTLDALPGRTFEGEIYAIDPIVDVDGRAIRLRARIPNPQRELSPGLFARVRLVVDRREGALLVPESAVFSRQKGHFVYRVVDGRAALTEVTLGARRPGQVEVRKGLGAADVVVTAGHQQVRNGGALAVTLPDRSV